MVVPNSNDQRVNFLVARHCKPSKTKQPVVRFQQASVLFKRRDEKPLCMNLNKQFSHFKKSFYLQ